MSELVEEEGVFGWTLQVVVARGTELLVCDREGTSDPYVKVFCGSYMLGQTAVAHKTLDPQWEASFSHKIKAPLGKALMLADKISFLVYDKDKWSKDDPMGAVRLDLLQMIQHGVARAEWHEEAYPIKPCEGCRRPKGTLLIRTKVEVHRRTASSKRYSR